MITRQTTIRELLQIIGTEAIRNNIHPNAWVNALFADYRPISGYGYTYDDGSKTDIISHGGYPHWVITDTRFENEASAIRQRGGIMVKVKRTWYATKCLSCDQTYNLYHENEYCPLCGSEDHNEMHPVQYLDNHPSETSLDNYEFDYVIDNSNGTLAELKEKVAGMLRHFKII